MGKIYYKDLKNNCFMQQADKDRFSLRLRIAGGKIDAKHLHKIYELAEKYGQGYVHLTARQSIEIPYIKLEDIETVKLEMIEAGLRQGVCGAKVRTITACQGNSVCQSGLIDTTELAQEFDKLFYANEVPHKFKIGITGCRNNCLKTEENDLGIKGAMKPSWQARNCTFCGLCQKTCPAKAIKVDKKNNTLAYSEVACRLCGKCVKACPKSAWQGKAGFTVYVGGLFGNSIQVGRELFPIIYTRDELKKVVEDALVFYRKHGKKSERFGKTINRVGWETVLDEFGPKQDLL